MNDELPPAEILVVDDHAPNVVALKAILAPLGHQIVEAQSALAALEFCATHEFAAILCDVSMPVMDGFELVTRLREDGLAPWTPVVLLSAVHTDQDSARRAYTVGAIDYVTTPFDPELFRWRVGALVWLYQRWAAHGRATSRDGARDRAAIVADGEPPTLALAREAERMMRRKDVFLGVLGHDLRTPLSAVLLTADRLVQLPDLPDKYRAPLRRLFRSAERMDRMVTDFLDFACASTASGFPIRVCTCDVKQVAEMIVEETSEANPGRTIELKTAGDLVADCDPDRTAQAMSNLLTNAVQHGEGTITMSVEGSDSQVTISVHNGGPPIPQEEMATLFDPFRRSDPGSAGWGLGLYIVREVARAHLGTVTVRSSQAEGTTFELRWARTIPHGPR